MKYLFCLGMEKKEIVLGEFEGEEKDQVLEKISMLIISGSFLSEKEVEPFFVVRYFYGPKMEVVKTEIAPLEIGINNGQVSLPKGWSFEEKAKAA